MRISRLMSRQPSIENIDNPKKKKSFSNRQNEGKKKTDRTILNQFGVFSFVCNFSIIEKRAIHKYRLFYLWSSKKRNEVIKQKLETKRWNWNSTEWKWFKCFWMWWHISCLICL